MGQPDPGGAEPEEAAAPEPGSWTEHQLGMLTGTEQGPPMARSVSELLLPPVSPPPASGHFRVALDHAPRAIIYLRKAAELFEANLEDAESLGDIPPPGVDEVSLHAVRIMVNAAIGPEGSLRVALEQGAAEFRRRPTRWRPS